MTAWNVLKEDSFSSLQINLSPGSGINSEFDAVVTFSGTLDIGGHVRGGILGGFIRKLFLGKSESFFTQEVVNKSYEQTGNVLVAPAIPGGIILHRVDHGQDLLFKKGSYLASDTSVEVSPFLQHGIRNSMFSGVGFFILRGYGTGMLACSGFGSIHKYTLARGERRAVDNGHILAWSASMPYQTKMAGSGIWGSMTSGEGLTCEFTGPGTVYVQSHNLETVMDYHKDRSSQRVGRSSKTLIWVIIVFFLVTSVVMNAVMQKLNMKLSYNPNWRAKKYRNQGRQEYYDGEFYNFKFRLCQRNVPI